VLATAVTRVSPALVGNRQPASAATPFASVVRLALDLYRLPSALTVPPSLLTTNLTATPAVGLRDASFAMTAGSDALATCAPVVSTIDVTLTAVSELLGPEPIEICAVTLVSPGLANPRVAVPTGPETASPANVARPFESVVIVALPERLYVGETSTSMETPLRGTAFPKRSRSSIAGCEGSVTPLAALEEGGFAMARAVAAPGVAVTVKLALEPPAIDAFT
jgi:hypothetical protein